MKTLEECYDIIVALNETAHSMAWDTWIEADRLSDESEDDDGWIRAEEMREQASLEQQEYFVDLFEELDEETKEACWKYRKEDENFRMEFDSWYGYEEDEYDE